MAYAPGKLLPLDAELIASQMVSGLLPFPYKKLYLKVPRWYFANLQKSTCVAISYKPYIRQLKHSKGRNRVRAAIANTPWGFDGKELSLVVGLRTHTDIDLLTDHFTEESRMAANVRSFPSPIEAWRDTEIALSIATTAVTYGQKMGGVAPYHLREASYAQVPECTLFKISLAAAIYKFFQAKVVLDPFAGWGDRGLGAAGAGVVKYIGLDPNPTLVPGHKKIIKFLSSVAPETCLKYRSIPVEEYGPGEFAEDFEKEPPTLVFSSPPFHDYEIYSKDALQSVAAGKNTQLDGWLIDWFFPALDRVWGALAPGGNLALYLTDANGEVTTPLCKHMELRKRPFRGVIACRRGKKRPIPLWVWQKSFDKPVEVPAAESSLEAYVIYLLTQIYAELSD